MDADAIPRDRQTLWTTRCCKIKSATGGRPCELYRSDLPVRFLDGMARLGLSHAIVSDLYGLHFPEVWKRSYDTAPGDLDAAERLSLGRTIGDQARRRGFSRICFYNNSPMMSRPYFEVLSHSGLHVTYHTRLPEAP
ncbi:hypothetical protein ABIA85_006563 [Bradyrhizobium sp. LA6.10]|uniref:hypothetical protein n=1 Tax=Bradyrhizobium sp. LA6.10 TaxID=3156318 RepID=UPI00339713F4